MTEQRTKAVRVAQAAWQAYAPFHQLASFQRHFHTPPSLAGAEHDRTVQHLTTFLTTGPVRRKEDFLNRAHELGLYPFAYDKPEDAPTVRREAPEALWSELLHNENGRPMLKAGSVPFLIHSLVSDYAGMEHTFLEDFLLTYRTFLTPRALLLLLILRYWVPLCSTSESGDEREKKHRILIQIRTVRVLSVWIETVPTDFTDDSVLAENATNFLTGIETFKVASGEILKLLKEKRTPHSAHHGNSEGHTTPLISRARCDSDGPERGAGVWVGLGDDSTNEEADSDGDILRSRSGAKLGQQQQDRSFLSFDAADVAYEWTLLAQRVYRAITPREFMKQAWNKKAKLELAPNVSALIDDFNQMSEWVSLVVLSYRDRKRRGEAISRFIQIAYECHKLKNYHTVMVVLSGLTKAHITRLKKSWEIVDNRMKGKLKLLNELMGMDSNYQQYRQALREMMPPTPSVPFLGLFLTDLTFLDEGNSDLMSSAERSASVTPSASSSPLAYTDSASATRTKRRSIFHRTKSDRSVKPEPSKLREASPSGHREDGTFAKAATMPELSRSPRPQSVHIGLVSSQKTLKVLNKKGQEEDNRDKRLSIKAVRGSLSIYMKETGEKMRSLRGKKASATFDEADLMHTWRDPKGPSLTPEEEQAVRAWKQIKEGHNSEMQESGEATGSRRGRRAQAKRMPQVFDFQELSALLEKEEKSSELEPIEEPGKGKECHGDEDNVKEKEEKEKEGKEVEIEGTMLINWMKKRTMAKVLREFLRFQGCHYPLPKKLEKRRRKLRAKSSTVAPSDHDSFAALLSSGPGSDFDALTPYGSADDMSDETHEEIRHMLREMRLPPDIANVLDFSTYALAPQTPLLPRQDENHRTPRTGGRGTSSAGTSPRARSETSISASPRQSVSIASLANAVAESQFRSPRASTTVLASSRTPPALSPRGPPVSIKRTTSMPAITVLAEDMSGHSSDLQRLDLSAATSGMTPRQQFGPPEQCYAELFTMKKLKLDDSLLFDLSLHLEPRTGSQVGNGPDSKKPLFAITPQTSPAATPYRSRNRIDRSGKESVTMDAESALMSELQHKLGHHPGSPAPTPKSRDGAKEEKGVRDARAQEDEAHMDKEASGDGVEAEEEHDESAPTEGKKKPANGKIRKLLLSKKSKELMKEE